MVDFLSSNATQDLLGVDPAKRGPFQYESRAVFDAFQTTYDWYAWPAPFYLAALLERGVRALVYVGAADYICNWVRALFPEFRLSLPLCVRDACLSMLRVVQIGTERMTLGLEWTRQEAFRNQSLVPWLVDRHERQQNLNPAHTERHSMTTTQGVYSPRVPMFQHDTQCPTNLATLLLSKSYQREAPSNHLFASSNDWTGRSSGACIV